MTATSSDKDDHTFKDTKMQGVFNYCELFLHALNTKKLRKLTNSVIIYIHIYTKLIYFEHLFNVKMYQSVPSFPLLLRQLRNLKTSDPWCDIYQHCFGTQIIWYTVHIFSF